VTWSPTEEGFPEATARTTDPRHWPLSTKTGDAARGCAVGHPGLIRQLGADPGLFSPRPGSIRERSTTRSAGYVRGVLRLLDEAAARTRCPHFGLLAGGAWHLADLGAIGD